MDCMSCERAITVDVNGDPEPDQDHTTELPNRPGERYEKKEVVPRSRIELPQHDCLVLRPHVHSLLSCGVLVGNITAPV